METRSINPKTLRLVESGIMLALATVLSLLPLWQMPLGGKITFCSMLPILIIGYKYGPKWGVLTGLAYSVIQLVVDAGLLSSFAGMTWQGIVGSAFLDYILAFSCLGLAGIYGKGLGRYIAGICTAVLLRLCSHVLSGIVIFYAYAFDSSSFPSYLKFLHGHIFLYSLAYNGFFIVPDLLICLVVGVALYFPLKRFF